MAEGLVSTVAQGKRSAALGNPVPKTVLAYPIRQTTTQDWRAREVRFFDELPTRGPPEVVFPIAIERGYPFLIGSFTPKLQMKTVGAIDGAFMIDLGSNHGIMIDWPVVDEHHLLAKNGVDQSICQRQIRFLLVDRCKLVIGHIPSAEKHHLEPKC